MIYNAGAVPGERAHGRHDVEDQRRSRASKTREVVILGTEYAGEMKKGVFTIMNYLMPKRGVLSMHCSATADPQDGDVSRVLRPVRHRQDDALGRSEAAAHRRRRTLLERRGHLQHRRRLLRQGDRPERRNGAGDLRALRFGAVLENVVLDPDRTPRLSRQPNHRKHARRLSDRVHSQRQDSLRRRPSDRRSSF